MFDWRWIFEHELGVFHFSPRISLTKECGWKDGDRGGLAEWEQTHGKKKAKVCLDINRPSHGRDFGLG